MARKKNPTTDGQAEIDGTQERPAIAGVRLILAEAKARLTILKVLGEMNDDVGRLLKVETKWQIELTTEEAQSLPEIGPAVLKLMELGTELPEEVKNTFDLGITRDFAGAKYTVSGKPGRVEFNGQVKGKPRLKVVKGNPSLVLTLVGVVREKSFEALIRHKSDSPKLTVEPPQQELDFGEAA